MLTDDQIEKMAVAHESFGYGLADGRGASFHEFEPAGILAFARAIEAAVLAEAAKDREDAERYRWLRDRSAWTLMSANGIIRLAHRLPTGFKPTPQNNGDDYDAAIDAARSTT